MIDGKAPAAFADAAAGGRCHDRRMDEAAIETRELRVRRGGLLVLPGVSLRIGRGLVTGLLGPSGSGKTTLLRAVVGVQIVESGDVLVLGEPAGTPSLRRRVGYVTQSPSVYRDLTIAENLRYFARVVGARRERIEEVAALVDLGGRLRQFAGTLSAGELGRASLAAALLAEPEVLVLDEPTVGVDPILRRDLWQTFHRLADAGATLIVSSHVMDEAARCDEIVLVRAGRVIATGRPDDLLRKTGTQQLEDAFIALAETP